ncbi:MAG: hypothetical protein V3T84_09515 [Phycisphaerales bacterium]
MRSERSTRTWRLAAWVLLGGLVMGCQDVRYDPARATQSYPHHLHQANSVNIQVFREDTSIELVNSTTRSYAEFDLWINQRYTSRIESLPAGATLRLSLWDFYDERGESLNAGGLFRSDDPTPVRLVEIQTADEEPLIGLITIRAEPVE